MSFFDVIMPEWLDIEIEEGFKGGPVGAGSRGGAGARGGNYYINSKGKIVYGNPPSGTRKETPMSIARKQRNKAKDELKDISTQDDIDGLDPNWEVGTSGDTPTADGKLNTYGTNKDAAMQDAIDFGKQHPDILYAIIKVDGNYMLAAKALKDFDLSPKDNPEPGADNVVSVRGRMGSGGTGTATPAPTPSASNPMGSPTTPRQHTPTKPKTPKATKPGAPKGP